jgi:hypothetical protein
MRRTNQLYDSLLLLYNTGTTTWFDEAWIKRVIHTKIYPLPLHVHVANIICDNCRQQMVEASPFISMWEGCRKERQWLRVVCLCQNTRQKATPRLLDGIPLMSVEMVIDCAYRGSCDVDMKAAVTTLRLIVLQQPTTLASRRSTLSRIHM